MAGVDGLTERVAEAAEEILPIKAFGVEGKEEDKAEDILCKARTGAGHVTDIMGCNKGSRAARLSVGHELGLAMLLVYMVVKVQVSPYRLLAAPRPT